MPQVIIYNQDNGVPAVIYPTPEAVSQHTILEIAVKDVPANKPFGIIDSATLPSRDSREAWVVDEAELTDGVGGISHEFG